MNKSKLFLTSVALAFAATLLSCQNDPDAGLTDEQTAEEAELAERAESIRADNAIRDAVYAKYPFYIEKAKKGQSLCTNLASPMKTYVEGGKRYIYQPKDEKHFFATDAACDIKGVCKYQFLETNKNLAMGNELAERFQEVDNLCQSARFNEYGGYGYKGDDFEGEILDNSYDVVGSRYANGDRRGDEDSVQDFVSYVTRIKTMETNSSGQNLILRMAFIKYYLSPDGSPQTVHVNGPDYDGYLTISTSDASFFDEYYE